MLQIILFLAGFALVVKGADLLIDGSAFIAKKFNVSEMAIGLTIVAFGTSMPELVVNVSASLKGVSDIAIGNVFGSNIANILLVVGVTAFFYPIPIKKKSLTIDLPFSLFAALLVVVLANTALLEDDKSMLLSYVEGLIMLLFFSVYMFYIVRTSKNKEQVIYEAEVKSLKSGVSLIYIVLGIIGLFFGGQWIVNGAVYLAEIFNLSESFIGLSAVAIGTTVPELVTSVMAGRKGSLDMAVGNIIGSNIFNLLWVLAVSALISPVVYKTVYNVEILIILVSGVLLFVAAISGRSARSVTAGTESVTSSKNVVGKISGIIFLLLYVVYLIYIYGRG